jgi:hypothetical protein
MPASTTHLMVLIQLRAIVDRHIPAAEIDHLAACGQMSVIKRSAVTHGSLRAGSLIEVGILQRMTAPVMATAALHGQSLRPAGQPARQLLLHRLGMQLRGIQIQDQGWPPALDRAVAPAGGRVEAMKDVHQLRPARRPLRAQQNRHDLYCQAAGVDDGRQFSRGILMAPGHHISEYASSKDKPVTNRQ